MATACMRQPTLALPPYIVGLRRGVHGAVLVDDVGKGGAAGKEHSAARVPAKRPFAQKANKKETRSEDWY